MASGTGIGSRGRDRPTAVGALHLRPDAELLASFVADQDADAFEVLVARHGPRVLRVCRQVLGRSADAEDAFQATFLLLASKARSIRKADSLGHWLHGVAHRVSVRARQNAARRRVVEREAPRAGGASGEVIVEIEELRRALHEEIDRLPARLREPILLCYLDGRTNEEAARLLGCPTSTVKERLTRGREVLRGRLARRGLALTALLMLLLLPGRASAEPVPPRLVRATVRAMRSRPDRPGLWALAGPPGAASVARIAITSTALLVLGAALVLTLPAPRRGSWLGWVIEVAREACH